MSIKKKSSCKSREEMSYQLEKLTFLTFHSIQKGKYEVEEIYVNLFFSTEQN